MTMTAALGDATVAELRSAVAGAVIVPGDPDYETARRTWNHAIDHRPAMIIRCTGTADVVAAVRFARSEGLPIAVRGGAHSVAGFSTCDDGLVLDLAQMRAVHVDPGAGRARAQGGTTWKQFDSETQLFGLATTGGLGFVHRAWRVHARRRDRSLGPQVWPHLRQPHLGRGSQCRRPSDEGHGRGEPGTVLGPARRRGELWCGDVIGARRTPRRPNCPRRCHLLSR